MVFVSLHLLLGACLCKQQPRQQKASNRQGSGHTMSEFFEFIEPIGDPLFISQFVASGADPGNWSFVAGFCLHRIERDGWTMRCCGHANSCGLFRVS